MADSPWPMIEAERRALADDLEQVPGEQWSTLALCPGWTVRDALAHMTATAKTTPGSFFAGLVGSGFNFERFSTKGRERERGESPSDALARFRAEVSSKKHPPGPVDSWLGETIVHAEDIRRPLGIAHQYPMEGLTRVADFYKKSNLLIGAKKRVDGVTLKATDTDWSSGSGPEASGPMLSLVMVMTGRKAALDDLSGDGVATLRGRG